MKSIMAVAAGPRRRLPYALLAAVAMVVVTGAAIVVWQTGGTEGDDAASCVAPQLLANPSPGELPRPGQPSGLAAPVTRGQTIDVVGRYYFADCFDVVMQGEAPRSQDAEQSVPITLLDDDTRYRLTVAHPNDKGTFHVQVEVPTDAQPGHAQLRDEVGHVVPLIIS